MQHLKLSINCPAKKNFSTVKFRWKQTMDMDDCSGVVENILATVTDNELLEMKEDTQQLAIKGQKEGSDKQINELSKRSILRYDREFLLKLQFDKDVSKTPITLPVIRELYPNKRSNKKFCKNYKDKGFGDDNNESKMETGDTYTCQFEELSKATVKKRVPPSDTFHYDDTCFIVIDCEGVNDETTEISDRNNGISVKLKDNQPLNVDDIQRCMYDKDKEHEKYKTGKQHKPNDRGKGRKRHITTEDWEKEHVGVHKRRRRSHERGYGRKRIQSSRQTYFGNRCYKSEEKRNRNWRSTKLNESKMLKMPPDAFNKVSVDDGKHNEETQRGYRDSNQNHPLLYENGMCIQTEMNNAETVNQELQLSPVSDRSLSPYADFTRTFRNGAVEKETGTFEDPVKSLEAEENSKDCLENKDKEIERVRTESNGDGRDSVIGHNFQTNFRNENNVQYKSRYQGNVYGFGNIPHTHHGTPLQMQYRFQYPTYPEPLTQYAPQLFPNYIYHPNRRHSLTNVQNKPQHYSNNIVVKEAAPIKNDNHYLISSNTLESLSTADMNKTVISMYRTLVQAEGLVFTPSEVKRMMKQCRPVQVEFASEDILFDLLELNEDKFIFEKSKRMISPKINIKLCPKFTNDPNSNHVCVCKDLHICKHYLLGFCNMARCKFGHQMKSKHNEEVLQCYSLEGISERCIKKLIRNIHNRNISTTPLVCKFYNNVGGCQRGESCTHLHLCTHFIRDDCKFQKCKRLHDFNDMQVRNVLEKHGLFPDDSNFEQIRNLLKATLANGQVKLKRELSSYQNTLISADTKRHLVSHRRTLSNVPSLGSYENTDSLEDEKTENKSKTEVNTESNNKDSKAYIQIFEDMQLNNCEHVQNKLPEFIPLDTSLEMKTENYESDIIGSAVAKSPHEEIDQAVNCYNINENIVNQEKAKLTKIESTNKTEIHTQFSGTTLPRWKPLHFRKENSTNIDENILIDDVSNTKTGHDTDVTDNVTLESRFSITSDGSTQESSASNLHIINENKSAKEMNNTKQLDSDGGNQCIPEIGNILCSSDQYKSKSTASSSHKKLIDCADISKASNFDTDNENEKSKQVNNAIKLDEQSVGNYFEDDEKDLCIQESDGLFNNNAHCKSKTKSSSSYKGVVENTEETTISNFDKKADTEAVKELNNLQQLDIKSTQLTSTADEKKECVQKVENVLSSNTKPGTKQKQEVLFEIIGMDYRVRKKGDCWQFRYKLTDENENGARNIELEAAWKNIPDDKTDGLKTIHHNFEAAIAKIL